MYAVVTKTQRYICKASRRRQSLFSRLPGTGCRPQERLRIRMGTRQPTVIIG